MQPPGALDLFQLGLDPADPLLDDAAIGFELRFPGTAEKAESAALALQVGPGAHQPALLVGEMGMLDLQRALPRAGAPAEYLQDQTRAVQHLGIPRFFQISLLHRGHRAIHDNQIDRQALGNPGDLLDLALAQIG